MEFLKDIAELEAHYGVPGASSLKKVADHITPDYRAWIEASPFCAMATIGPEGLDCSPRGDAGPVVEILDEKTLAMPDRRGNNRMDSLRNIMRDPRISLMFLVHGSGTVIRINGTARITVDADLKARFARDGAAPRSIVLITVQEVYFQCARAVIRAGIWEGGIADPKGLPSPGQILQTLSHKEIDGAAYDAEWPGRAAKTMW